MPRVLLISILLPLLTFSIMVEPARAQSVTYKTYGLDFGPYIAPGEDPNAGTQLSEPVLRQRMAIIAPYTQWIRTYSSRNGLEKAGSIAHSLGLKAAVGAWIGRNATANEQELVSAIAMANAREADMVIVGSEALLRNDIDAATLRSHILRVRSQIPSDIPVTCADTYGALLANQGIIDASDVVMANIFPFHEEVPVTIAIGALDQAYLKLVAAAGSNKSVLISETGFPSGGTGKGSAVPSPGNAAAYFLNFVSWARARNVGYFYFEALDEPWKAASEGPYASHWGVWDRTGALKAGMQAVFDGNTVADNWSGAALAGGAGIPSIDFIYIPVAGDTRRLVGQVLHVRPVEYRVAAYIKVGTAWYTKPTYADKLTPIAPDGTFTVNVTTGLGDVNAVEIRAYLVPVGYDAPIANGTPDPPADLASRGYIFRTVIRGPKSIRGQVLDGDLNPVAGVTISLTGSVQLAAQTSVSGEYSFPALADLPSPGSITITPSKAGIAFSPASKTVTSLSAAADFSVVVPPAPVLGTGLRFVPVTPCRVADTRENLGAFGLPALAANAARSFALPQRCGLPSNAAAYSLNVTVVPQGPLGYITLWPTGAAQPFVSTLNSVDGRAKANAALVPAGTAGAISVFATNATHLVLDINGYFIDPVSNAQALAFYPLTPCRIADTRNPAGLLGGPAIAANASRDFPVISSSCGVPANAQAYSMNATVVPSGPLGYLTLWPTGQTQPFVSTLNAITGAVVANAAIVPAGTNGSISAFVSNQSHLVLDINGYFAPPGAANAQRFFAVTPCRLLDTREAAGEFGGPVLAAGQARSYRLPLASCGLPGAAAAFSLNATVVPTAALGFLTLWPTGSAQPNVSTLNAVEDAVVANAAIVPAGTAGAVSSFVTSQTHLILDTNGYFAP